MCNGKCIGWRLDCDLSCKIIYIFRQDYNKIAHFCLFVICFKVVFIVNTLNACIMLEKFNNANWHTKYTKSHQSVCWFQLSISNKYISVRALINVRSKSEIDRKCIFQEKKNQSFNQYGFDTTFQFPSLFSTPFSSPVHIFSDYNITDIHTYMYLQSVIWYPKFVKWEDTFRQITNIPFQPN